MTGMGVVVPVADAAALAEGLREVLRNPDTYRRPRAEITAMFDLAATVDAYERLFDELRRETGSAVGSDRDGRG
jgi:glycosyltransferase involved in cell wall biosynthesis